MISLNLTESSGVKGGKKTQWFYDLSQTTQLEKPS